MSGGVDSSVAAYLLKAQGWDVVGITFQLYDYSRQNRKEGKGGCCSLEDVEDARAVCYKLGIKHYLFDSRARFKERVLDYFAASYKAGKTPNPCVACNTFIKFDELAHYAKAVDATYYATGHYARLIRENDEVILEAGADEKRDQSYFLMGVNPEHLKHMLLPVGDYSKDEIRRMAHEQGLPVGDKPDSMEICFVPDNNYRKFLSENYELGDEPGDFVDTSGRVLGTHHGIHHFTVGQKKGLGAYGIHDAYVVEIRSEQKQVVLGRDESLFSEGMGVELTQFRNLDLWKGKALRVKIRSKSAFLPARILEIQGSQVQVQFEEPQRAVTPGQFAVFYDGLRVLGGGPILKAMAKFAHVA